MAIEPHEVTSVHIPAMPPNPPECRTLQDYQSDLVRRFGRVPSWTELARRENNAMLHRQGQSSMARSKADAMAHPNSRARVQAILDRGEASRASIMAALTKPMTCPDVANVLKRSPSLIRRHLQILAEQGRVTGHAVKGITIWERRKEAAE